jgi:Family of unknown function (DUF5343)
MPADLPYMPSVTNPKHPRSHPFSGYPPRFTHEFLKSNLGFSSSNDRAVIKVLKQLGFLTSDGTPTPRYNDYRGPDGGRVLAEGLRDGWLRCF